MWWQLFSQSKLSRLVKWCVWHAFPKKRLVCDLAMTSVHAYLIYCSHSLVGINSRSAVTACPTWWHKGTKPTVISRYEPPILQRPGFDVWGVRTVRAIKHIESVLRSVHFFPPSTDKQAKTKFFSLRHILNCDLNSQH